MKLADYSTVVDAAKTVGEIQAMLQAHGAKSVMVGYADKEPVGLSFLIDLPQGDLSFRLPANIEKVAKVISSARIRGRYNIGNQEKDKKQASRVAWRILRDWVRAQLAIIETEMVTLDQVFLPYMQVGESGRSFYEVMQTRLLQLSAGKEHENDKTIDRE